MQPRPCTSAGSLHFWGRDTNIQPLDGTLEGRVDLKIGSFEVAFHASDKSPSESHNSSDWRLPVLRIEIVHLWMPDMLTTT